MADPENISLLPPISHNPDVLSCLANLSNDEVFTPPNVANVMLDMLPQEMFKNPNVKFLDPVCKSGVFLREITKRLMKGLEKKIPDQQKRLDHILHNQVYGIAITELTSLLSRRTLYCAKYATSPYSISKFSNIDGNIRFKAIQHTFDKNGKCIFCGASQSQYERGEGLETHAYEFIHTDNPQEIFGNMKFDVIIGNPPYQLDTEGAGKQAKPIYQKFVNTAKKLMPQFLVMITPSRWFAGGMGLDNFRDEMLNDKHLKKIVDYSLSTLCFPGVDIAGGVNYFLWDRGYTSNICEYTFIDRDTATTSNRLLNEHDIFVRNNNSISIVNKVLKQNHISISSIMSSLGVFGLGTAERGIKIFEKNCLKLLSSAGYSYIKKAKVKSGINYVDKWKVIIGKATSAGAATADREGKRKVIATLDLLEPNAVCTFSYFIAGSFASKNEAKNCLTYISTKFVRFLLLQTLSSINITKERFQFVPIQDFSKPWTDAELYAKYNLTQDEIDFIESMIKPMDISLEVDNEAENA